MRRQIIAVIAMRKGLQTLWAISTFVHRSAQKAAWPTLPRCTLRPWMLEWFGAARILYEKQCCQISLLHLGPSAAPPSSRSLPYLPPFQALHSRAGPTMEQMCCLSKPHRLAEAETQIASYMQTSSESRQFRNRILQPWPACMELRLGVGVYPRGWRCLAKRHGSLHQGSNLDGSMTKFSLAKWRR